MGFNYGYEKKKFDSRWKRLEVEYCDAGMSEEQIAAMKEYDWAWFCSQRVFQNHTQPIPCEQYDEVCGQSQLFRKFASLSYQWDVDNFLCSVCAKWLRVLYRCWPSGVYRKMHPSCKASGKKRYIPQAAKCPSLSCSVSLLEPNMSDKTKVQRWTLFLGGDGIGNSSIWYGRA